jgi:hypothetical protein
VRRGREAAHVDPDLGDDDLGGALPDAGDGGEPAELLIERAEQFGHLPVESADARRQVVDMGEVFTQHDPVVFGEAAFHRLAQLVELGPELGLGEVGEDLRFDHPVDLGIKHRPPGLA